VAALRTARPGCEIGFAVKSQFADLVAGDPSVDRIHVLDTSAPGGLRELCRGVRAAGYAAVVDLHRNARSAAIVRAARASVTAEYVKRDRGDWLRVRLFRRPFRASRRLVERYLEALAPLGVDAPYAKPRFHVAARDAAWGEAFVAGRGLRPRSYAVVAPGAVWATKRWPAERFGAVARDLFVDLGLPAVLVGSAAERPICEQVAAAAGADSPTTVAAGEATLGGTAGIVAQGALFLGNDSGLTHVAMALDTPTVAVFGPTDPAQFDFEGHAVVFADTPCSACSFFGGERCRLRHWDCMRLIEAQDVSRAARALLAARGRST